MNTAAVPQRDPLTLSGFARNSNAGLFFSSRAAECSFAPFSGRVFIRDRSSNENGRSCVENNDDCGASCVGDVRWQVETLSGEPIAARKHRPGLSSPFMAQSASLRWRTTTACERSGRCAEGRQYFFAPRLADEFVSMCEV